MKIRINRFSLIIIGFVLVLSIMTLTEVSATPPDMRTYCAQPPFLGSTTTPNVLVILDNSGSMNCLAYQTDYNPNQFNKRCSTNWSQSCSVDGDCPSSGTCASYYYGYFDPAKNYAYSTSVTPNRWVVTASAMTSGTTTNPIATGNLLNWITMSRQDVAKKILIGGRASSFSSVANYNVADRTTNPVLLYGDSDSTTGLTCTTNYKSYDGTTAGVIYPFVGDYKYTVPTGNVNTFSIAFNDPSTVKLYPTSNYTGTNPVYSFPAAWLKTGGANAYQLVDETTANTTDYITNKSTTEAALFGYNKADATLATASGTISSITVYAYAKKTGASTMNLQAVLVNKSGGADLVTASGLSATSTSWTAYPFSFPTNPQTGLAWQWSDLTGSAVNNLLAFGVKTVGAAGAAPTSSVYVGVSQIYIQINVSSPSAGGPYNIIVDQGATPARGVLDAMSSEVRFGLTHYNSGGDGGHIANITSGTDTYVRYGSIANVLQNISIMRGSPTTPLSETLFEMERYFAQLGTYYSTSDYTMGCTGAANGGSTCGASVTPTTADPYYFDFSDPTVPDGYVPCAKSFVILMTDGEPYNDQNIPGTSTSSPYAACSATNIKACSGRLCDNATTPTCVTKNPRYGGTTVGQAYPNSGSDYLIDVAYWGRTTDLRPGAETDTPAVWRRSLPGTQNVYLYPVYLFGRNSTLLTDAAIYGGFEDINGNGRPDCDTVPEECYRDSNGDGYVRVPGTANSGVCSNSPSTHCSADATCIAISPGGVCNYDDPITYFQGDDGYQLEQGITDAINAILQRVASGTAASVLASGEGSGANLVQSIFYPKRSFVGSSEVSWIGTLSNMWYYIDPRLNSSSIREDTTQDRALKLTQDRIVEYSFNATTNQTGMNLFADSDGNGVSDSGTTPVATADMDTLKYLWEAGRLLFQRTGGDENPVALYASTARTIFTNTNDDSTLDAFAASSAATLRPLLGLATNTDASELIKYIRGNDTASIDLDGNGTADTLRSRTTTVNISGSNVTSTWKLGDTINSTPRLVSWTPLNKYDKTYLDRTYKDYYSSSVYKNRGMVFVGGNDGMLHAFKLGLLGIYNEADRKATLGKYCSTTTAKGCSTDSDCPASESCLTDADIGKEAWAFIPKNSLPYLLYQAKSDYCHLYYIDASPVIFDASIEAPGVHTGDYWTQDKTSSSWRTVLIGGMRYGGACRSNGTSCSECSTTPISGNSVGLSSYFALDITDPESPTLLWEYANSELGYSSTGPAILRINAKTHCSIATGTSCNYDGDCTGANDFCLQDKTKDGRWFVAIGSGPSGYVSPTSKQFMGVTEHGLPVAGKGNIKLHVLDLKTGALLRAIDAGEDSAFAGSFANATIDIDGDYSDDALYFGFTARNALGTAATAQAGSTATTIKLAAASSAVNGFYTGKFIHRNDGAHETKLIINYDGTTKIAGVDSSWQTIPTNATQYNILDGWNTGGVKRLFTKESINPANWAVSDVIRTTGPVTASVAKLLDIKTHKLRLFFGTGRYYYKISQIVDDAATSRRLYGVIDPCIIVSGTSTVVNTACTTTVSEADLGAADGFTNLDGSTDIYGNSNTTGSSDSDGWYIPLQAQYGTNSAERMVTDPLATTIGVVFFTTTKPSTDVCTFGGKSYIWKVRYDTGGTTPSGIVKGKAMIQLSTGAIQQVDLATAFNAQGNRRTSITMQGLPPMDQSLNVPMAPAPINKILHMQKK